MEQATLNQYFPTRRKGLEGVHPAKRRKVDATVNESSVAVRRSIRVKKQVVASSETKTTSRTQKGARRKAKDLMNEKSVESSSKIGIKTFSEPTSLFDDHAFAEAFIGKLSESQRKRKMVSSKQTDDTATDASKGTSSPECISNLKNGGEADSKPKNRRQAGKTRSCKLTPIDQHKVTDTPSEITAKSSNDRSSLNADSPKVKEADISTSPSKTPPVVRRIGSGIKGNPWIAEQAKMVLSRGKAAVKMSQKTIGKGDNTKNMEGQFLTPSKHESDLAVKHIISDSLGARPSKAQEDLAKARKLRETMKLLKRSSYRSQSPTTKEPQQRLHQVALSPLKPNEKTASKSQKEVPAYERFHTLAQCNLSSESPAHLPLPYKYKTLAEMFRCSDTVLNLLGQRKEKCTFTKLRDAVQQMSRKRFEKKHLAQIKSVYPSSLEFHQDRNATKSSLFELTIEFGKGEGLHSKLTLTATELLARKDVFERNLLKLTKKHHQSFLQNLNPPVSVDDKKIVRWHPKFHVDDVPDISEAELPQAPVVKTYNSAHDVLEKARDMIAPRVEKALKTVIKGTEEKEFNSGKKEINTAENKTSKTAENTQIKNNKNDSALKGISQDLLNKIRLKEAKRIEESMIRDPLVDKKLAMKERLPDLCRILKAYFSTERKAAIPLEDATVKLSESYKTSLSPVQVEEHIRFMSQLLPEWISVLMVRKCAYIKINKAADVNNVINKLMTKEIH
ncbi:DNA replication factor Cdt1-like isoform X1 [Acropora millepora]|uniref:DNA replication factor Cdt1-like isoform X1 n=1 Tax=Acropora millepora TaxID=45264 RepID=UPI001CF4FB59|nr:DNA replication factor Cdt1-like isoform X1 [Acropora millepora]